VKEPDALINRLGVKGLGEIGIVGVAAAIANAVHHASGRSQSINSLRNQLGRDSSFDPENSVARSHRQQRPDGAPLIHSGWSQIVV
jgi:hypothetical protein